MAKKLALFTNNPGLVTFFQGRSDYNLVASLDKKDQILSSFQQLDNQGNLPELVLVTRAFDEASPTPTKDILISLKKTYGDRLRIVYIIGEVEYDQKTAADIKDLINAGIYDLVPNSSLTGDMIVASLENPHTYEEASKILNIPEYENETYSNVVLISSLKPGTGKTFLATNLAVAIAKYGQDKRLPDGSLRRPRIAIVDGDLLNLAVGSTFRTDNYDRNMFTALKKIAESVKYDGSYTMNDSQLNELKNFVRNCLVRYKNVDNLYCMVAPEIPLGDLSRIAPVHFYFMIQMLAGAFDVIIVDSNSSFDHQTTGPLYEMAGTIYLLIDNDYNNIQNNLRYIKQIERLGYKNKVHFVINKDLTNELESMCLEDLAYNTQTLGDLLIEHRIPLVPYGIVKGLDYAEKLLVTETTPETQDARNAILEFANDIWKIENSMIVKDAVEKEEAEKPKKKNGLLDKLNK
jgi:MinD-like ATPase involved in chromosome partitioning or flagellar assembly